MKGGQDGFAVPARKESVMIRSLASLVVALALTVVSFSSALASLGDGVIA